MALGEVWVSSLDKDQIFVAMLAGLCSTEDSSDRRISNSI